MAKKVKTPVATMSEKDGKALQNLLTPHQKDEQLYQRIQDLMGPDNGQSAHDSENLTSGRTATFHDPDDI